MLFILYEQFKFKTVKSCFQLDAASALTLNTITLMTFMAASSAPTPLYRLYQQLWQFSPVTLTLIFATYALRCLAHYSLLVLCLIILDAAQSLLQLFLCKLFQ